MEPNQATPSDAVEARAMARVGLLGNPSDIYGGRGIGFTFQEMGAAVQLRPADEVFLPNALLKAGWKVFKAFLTERGRDSRERPFELRQSTNVPLRSGLAGSSALLIAALRAWASWFGLLLPPQECARLALEAEMNELGIRAGALDRLVQACEGLIAMDFARPWDPGSITRLDPRRLPPLFLAWTPDPGTSSGDAHGKMWRRYQDGDPHVRATMRALATLADQAPLALESGDIGHFQSLVDRNFELRANLFKIPIVDRRMVELARTLKCAAKLCGSGGSALVVPPHSDALPAAREAFHVSGFRTLVPTVATTRPVR